MECLLRCTDWVFMYNSGQLFCKVPYQAQTKYMFKKFREQNSLQQLCHRAVWQVVHNLRWTKFRIYIYTNNDHN